MPPHLGPTLLMGGAWITTYNTTVSGGYYQSVPVYFNTTYSHDTTYSHTTSSQSIEWT